MESYITKSLDLTEQRISPEPNSSYVASSSTLKERVECNPTYFRMLFFIWTMNSFSHPFDERLLSALKFWLTNFNGDFILFKTQSTYIYLIQHRIVNIFINPFYRRQSLLEVEYQNLLFFGTDYKELLSKPKLPFYNGKWKWCYFEFSIVLKCAISCQWEIFTSEMTKCFALCTGTRHPKEASLDGCSGSCKLFHGCGRIISKDRLWCRYLWNSVKGSKIWGQNSVHNVS